MSAKHFLVWWAAAFVVRASAEPVCRGPVSLPGIDIRAAVAPDQARLAPDGRVWLSGGFERADGRSTGDLVRLGPDGGFDKEPVRGWLSPPFAIASSGGSLVPIPTSAMPFFLANRQMLFSDGDGRWLRVGATGAPLGKAFPGRGAGEAIIPQFEQNGMVWLFVRTPGGTRLARARAADGVMDASFQPAAEWPPGETPVQAVPGPNGGTWMLTRPADNPFAFLLSGSAAPAGHVMQVTATGSSGTVVTLRNEQRMVDIRAAEDGGFMVHYGENSWRGFYWPAPQSASHLLARHSADGSPVFLKTFVMPQETRFCWAAAADGSFVAMGGERVASPLLGKYHADGSSDPDFSCEGPVWSALALPGGKWLVNGLRRLLPDGTDDPAWTAPLLERPAHVKSIARLSPGRVLVAGDFSSVAGMVHNRLAVLRANGAPDPSFTADERIGEVTSVAVAGEFIYVVSASPETYGGGVTSNLLKLRGDGSLDESFRPALPTASLIGSPTLAVGPAVGNQPRSTAIVSWPPATALSVQAIGRDGDILVESHYLGGDIMVWSLARLRPDGTPPPGSRFGGLSGRPFALSSGKFFINGTLHSGNGSPERDLTAPGTSLAPLCEMPQGVLFVETHNSSNQSRLRLWNGRAWEARYRPPGLAPGGWFGIPRAATSCPDGTVYLTANLASRGAGLFRLLPDGRLDSAFQSPSFTRQVRQAPGFWWTAGESGRIPCRPAVSATDAPPAALLYQPGTGCLWTGGAFTVVDGRPRDGVARFVGGGRGWTLPFRR